IPPESSDKETSFQNQVAQDLLRAELAAQLAVISDPSLAPEAYLLGVAAEADRWISLTADGPEVCGEKLLPTWLKQSNTRPAWSFVEKARSLAQQALLDGMVPPVFSSSVNQESKPLAVLASEAGGAQAGLGGQEVSGRIPIDWASLQDRVAQAVRRWAQPLPGLPRTFPQLLCALGSWQVLERQWADALERAKLEALAELAAGAGHEINNPLAVIAGRAQLLLQQETDPERRRSLALIVAQVRRAYEMIADLRLFARPPRPQMEPVELAGLLNGLVQELGAVAAEQGAAMSWSGHPGPVHIQADPVQLQIAVRAVVQNALEALGRQGHIHIALHEEPGWVHIRVEDDGPGIPPDVREHLFDPFYSARSAGRGLGLGLSKAWRIVVSNHHGRILVDSTPGQGTGVELILPKNPTNILQSPRPSHEPTSP
ncbi:MAG TPA: HAMP domain-containing sensor histidine kinase, partial [Thermoguttaceae bacterium]|nr:HAMP domain-containing sensor histidine kinase [Thermoguttaceae bacterium]